MTVREQVRSTGFTLALMVAVFPALFVLADWLRHGTSPDGFWFGVYVGATIGGGLAALLAARVMREEKRP